MTTPQPPTAPSPPVPGQLDDQARLAALSAEANRLMMDGYQLVSRDDLAGTAVLSKPGKGVSHLLHFFLSLFTLGVWLPVWLLLSIFQKREKRVMLWVDPQGKVARR